MGMELNLEVVLVNDIGYCTTRAGAPISGTHRPNQVNLKPIDSNPCTELDTVRAQLYTKLQINRSEIDPAIVASARNRFTRPNGTRPYGLFRMR